MDHVSDSFLETTMPLIMMIEAAQAGNEREVEECAKLFTDHAAKLEEVRFSNWISFVMVIILTQTQKCRGSLVTGEEHNQEFNLWSIYGGKGWIELVFYMVSSSCFFPYRGIYETLRSCLASFLALSTYNIIQPTFESKILWDILILHLFFS